MFGKDFLTTVIDNANPICQCISYKSEICRLIYLPLLKVAEKEIIHELNHALTETFLTENIYFSKSGIEVDGEETIINELINERISFDICKIFKRRGGDFSKIKLNTFMDFYTKNLYLIDEFYNKFKDIIKESYITINKNNLVQRIG